MDKVDYKKELKHLYAPSHKEVSVVEVPPLHYLMVDGAGDPNTSQAFLDATEALYPVAYALKFMSKTQLERDFTVMPMQGLWWTEDMADFSTERKDDWLWTLMLMQPDYITAEMVERACEKVRKDKNPTALPKLRFERYDEGLSVQIMHIGPYAIEGPTVAKLHQYMDSNGYTFNGKHHEVYLSDPRKSAPEKMKTVIRQPMRRKG